MNPQQLEMHTLGPGQMEEELKASPLTAELLLTDLEREESLSSVVYPLMASTGSNT